MPTKSLHGLLKHELKDLYSAETQLIEAIPEMAEAANRSGSKKTIHQRLTVTKKSRETA